MRRAGAAAGRGEGIPHASAAALQCSHAALAASHAFLSPRYKFPLTLDPCRGTTWCSTATRSPSSGSALTTASPAPAAPVRAALPLPLLLASLLHWWHGRAIGCREGRGSTADASARTLHLSPAGIADVFHSHYDRFNAGVLAIGGDQTAHLL